MELVAEDQSLVSLVEKLRQEQEFSAFYRTQIQQAIRDINHCCDQVFQRLWLSQCLAHLLDQTQLHRMQCAEWSAALEQSGHVRFVEAVKVLKSNSLIESYKKFLGNLLENPAVLARVLVWVESEGRDSASLAGDLISVVYGHCVFQSDHTLFLQLLRQLLDLLVSSAESPREVFSGVEPVFCRVLTEFCNQLSDLHTFMAEALCDPLAEVLAVEEHLEFDVGKAGNRIQSSADAFGPGWLLDGSAFLFGEDLDLSCGHLARLAAQFVDGIARCSAQFPASLKWILACLKSLMTSKWPDISQAEIRQPVSSLLFGAILGSGLVNPDSHGVCEIDVVVGPVARYNLSQVAAVLQGCAWVMERQGGKFPMQKVIKKMDTEAYCNLLDTLDRGYGPDPPDLPSSLPGLKRTAYLTSQAQLNDLVGVVCEAAKAITKHTSTSSSSSSSSNSSTSSVHESLSRLTKQLSLPKHQMTLSSGAYSLHTLSSSAPATAHTPTRPHSQRPSDTHEPPSTPSSSGTVTGGGSGGKVKGETKKKMNVDAVGKSSGKSKQKRSSSTSNLNQIAVGGGTVTTGSSRSSTRSISPNRMMGTHLEVAMGPSLARGGQGGAPCMPREVLILPVAKTPAGQRRERGGGRNEWDFAVLSQDEFMQQLPNTSTTPFRHTTTPITADSTRATPTTTDSTCATPTTTDSTYATPTTTADSTHTTPITAGSAHATPTNVHTAGQQPPASPTHSTDSHTHSTPTDPTKSESSEPIPPSSVQIPACHHSVPETSAPRYPTPIAESPTGHQTGTESGSNSTNSLRSPVREQWERRIQAAHSGTGMRQTNSTGSDSSLSTCMSSREPSSSPQTVPKKRSFTITSIENGKFQLNLDLQGSRLVSPPPPLLSPSSPVPIITTPPVTSPPLSNGVIHPTRVTLSPTHTRAHLSNGTDCPATPIEARLTPSMRTDSAIQTTYSQQNHNTSPVHFDLSASDHDHEQLSSGCDTPATVGSSVENLLERAQGDGGGGLGVTNKTKKKKKWRLRRHKKGVKEQLSLQEEQRGDSDDVLRKKQRSKSHHVSVALDNRGEGHGAVDCDGARNAPQTSFRRRRSNTIIDKYRAIVDEQKKKKVPAVVMEKMESLPQFVDVRVGEMGPGEFGESLYCTQLEYKLRAALQNVHTPLVPAGLGARGGKEAGLDLKCGLTGLLEGALQRSKWSHNNMDTALLSETLRMVVQLPNTLVGVALRRAHQEHQRRQAYADYLVQSHMKFLDVRLQVRAVQTAVDRQQEVLREKFLQFSVRQFLESQTGQLAELHQTVVSLGLADERCSFMARRLESLTVCLLEDPTWSYWPREEMQLVSNYLEDQLFSLLYPHVFQPNSEVDRQKDEVYSAHLARLSEGLTPTHQSLQISPVYHSGCPWLAAQKHLMAMSHYKSPRGKVHCIAKSCRVLISLLQFAKVGSPPGADDLFPVLVYILIKANPPALLSTTQYIKNFLEDQLVGEENYWWVQFSTAVEFTKTLE